jgi:hypothetical protein
MTSKEFVIWLKGFTEGVHEFNITPKQWDLMKDKLEQVSDKASIEFPFGTPNTTPNTQPFPTWQHPHYVDPYNPYKITCTPGTTSTPNFAVTTTPSTTGHITIANPYIASFGSGSYNPSSITFTTHSNVTYTTNGTPNWYTAYFADLKDKTND